MFLLNETLSLEGLCPVDGENVNPFFQDISCQREIYQLICFCNNHDVGCTWKEKLQNLAVSFFFKKIKSNLYHSFIMELVMFCGSERTICSCPS